MYVNLLTRNSVSFFLLLLIYVGNAYSSEVQIPHQFAAGSPAKASEVNANFNALTTGVNDNSTRVDQLLSSVAALQNLVASMQSEISSLKTTVQTQAQKITSLENQSTNQAGSITAITGQVATLNTKVVDGLNDYLSIEIDAQGHPAAVFSAVNVQINNGTSHSDVRNGLGNLIIGMDETTDSTVERCSNGSYLDRTTCNSQGQTWAVSHKNGSHNVIIGPYHNYSANNGLVTGSSNNIMSYGAVAIGGNQNAAQGYRSVAIGGIGNTARNGYSLVIGGSDNQAQADYSLISGGAVNTTTGKFGSIFGGTENTASGEQSTVTGGYSNISSGLTATVGGGGSNTASGVGSVVSGGFNRSATGQYDWVAGSLFQEQ